MVISNFKVCAWKPRKSFQKAEEEELSESEGGRAFREPRRKSFQEAKEVELSESQEIAELN